MGEKRGAQMINRKGSIKGAVSGRTQGLFVATTSFSAAASAAKTQNGVACEKDVQKVKTGSKQYVRDTNSYVSPTKSTWTLDKCSRANDLYIEAKDQYDILKNAPSASPESQVELLNLLRSSDSPNA